MPRMVFTADQVKDCLRDLGYEIEDKYLDRFIHGKYFAFDFLIEATYS